MPISPQSGDTFDHGAATQHEITRKIAHDLSNSLEIIMQSSFLLGTLDLGENGKAWHKLLEEEGAAPKEFRKSFIQYKSLKKFLKYRRLNTGLVGGKDAMEAEKAFLRLLHTQLKEVDRWATFGQYYFAPGNACLLQASGGM